MDRGSKEWTESRIELCWVAIWYLWCSEGVREKLMLKGVGRSLALNSEIDFNELERWHVEEEHVVFPQEGK